MPFEMTTIQLPGGARCLRMECTGTFTKEDAGALIAQDQPGGQLDGVPVLVLTQKMDTMSSEARAIFGGNAPHRGWVAMVITSPLIRVTTNFLMRINKNPRLRMFAGEAEAIRWLDERTREDPAQVKEP